MQDTKETSSRRQNALLRLANVVVKIVGIAIFLVLVRLSLCYTQYMMPGEIERMVTVRDSVPQNLAFLAIWILIGVFLILLEKKLGETARKRLSVIALIAAMLVVAVQSFWWIFSAVRVPVGDQAFIYGGASYFQEGSYAFLDKGGYYYLYPHQLGLTALMEALFCVVGTYNYMAFEVICAVLAVGIVLAGYLFLKEVTDSLAAALMYCISMTACLPMIFYTSWVYGDLPSIFFLLLCAWGLLRLEKTRKLKWVFVAAFAMMMAMLVRLNSVIFLIAACIVGCLCALQHKNFKLIIALALSILLPVVAYGGIYKMYEDRSGYEHFEGIPAVGFIAMGLQENYLGNGWYSDYHKTVFWETDCDRQKTAEISEEKIRERLQEFRNDPRMAYQFFYQKMASQWDAPLFQSLYFNGDYSDENMPGQDTLVYKLSHEYFGRALAVADRLQFIIYAGMLFYFMFCVKGRSEILWHMLVVTVIGGFLFSIFWEAKARYIFPYYILMFPMAAVGYRELYCSAGQLYSKVRACFLKKNRV